MSNNFSAQTIIPPDSRPQQQTEPSLHFTNCSLCTAKANMFQFPHSSTDFVNAARCQSINFVIASCHFYASQKGCVSLVVNEFIQYNVFSPKASSRNLSGDRCLERVLVFLRGLKHPCLTPIEDLLSPVLPTESMRCELTCTFDSSQNKVEVTTATARRRMDKRCPETDLK